MKAVNIRWDVDEEQDISLLPSEIIFPDNMTDIDIDIMSDYISDITGFCHNGFQIED